MTAIAALLATSLTGSLQYTASAQTIPNNQLLKVTHGVNAYAEYPDIDRRSAYPLFYSVDLNDDEANISRAAQVWGMFSATTELHEGGTPLHQAECAESALNFALNAGYFDLVDTINKQLIHIAKTPVSDLPFETHDGLVKAAKTLLRSHYNAEVEAIYSNLYKTVFQKNVTPALGSAILWEYAECLKTNGKTKMAETVYAQLAERIVVHDGKIIALMGEENFNNLELYKAISTYVETGKWPVVKIASNDEPTIALARKAHSILASTNKLAANPLIAEIMGGEKKRGGYSPEQISRLINLANDCSRAGNTPKAREILLLANQLSQDLALLVSHAQVNLELACLTRAKPEISAGYWRVFDVCNKARNNRYLIAQRIINDQIKEKDGPTENERRLKEDLAYYAAAYCSAHEPEKALFVLQNLLSRQNLSHQERIVALGNQAYVEGVLHKTDLMKNDIEKLLKMQEIEGTHQIPEPAKLIKQCSRLSETKLALTLAQTAKDGDNLYKGQALVQLALLQTDKRKAEKYLKEALTCHLLDFEQEVVVHLLLQNLAEQQRYEEALLFLYNGLDQYKYFGPLDFATLTKILESKNLSGVKSEETLPGLVFRHGLSADYPTLSALERLADLTVTQSWPAQTQAELKDAVYRRFPKQYQMTADALTSRNGLAVSAHDKNLTTSYSLLVRAHTDIEKAAYAPAVNNIVKAFSLSDPNEHVFGVTLFETFPIKSLEEHGQLEDYEKILKFAAQRSSNNVPTKSRCELASLYLRQDKLDLAIEAIKPYLDALAATPCDLNGKALDDKVSPSYVNIYTVIRQAIELKQLKFAKELTAQILATQQKWLGPDNIQLAETYKLAVEIQTELEDNLEATANRTALEKILDKNMAPLNSAVSVAIAYGQDNSNWSGGAKYAHMLEQTALLAIRDKNLPVAQEKLTEALAKYESIEGKCNIRRSVVMGELAVVAFMQNDKKSAHDWLQKMRAAQTPYDLKHTLLETTLYDALGAYLDGDKQRSTTMLTKFQNFMPDKDTMRDWLVMADYAAKLATACGDQPLVEKLQTTQLKRQRETPVYVSEEDIKMPYMLVSISTAKQYSQN